MKISQHLKASRREAGMSIDELSRISGIAPRDLVDFEWGARIPSDQIILDLAMIFDDYETVARRFRGPLAIYLRYKHRSVWLQCHAQRGFSYISSIPWKD